MKNILAYLNFPDRQGSTRDRTERIQAPLYLSVIGWALLGLAFPLLWWAAQSAHEASLDDRLFVFGHTALELFAVLVATLIFGAGYRSFFSERKIALVLLGVAFLGVGVLDFLHLMSYVGLPVAITANTPQKSMFFWLSARMLAAIALLCYAALPRGHDVTTASRRLALGVMLLAVSLLAYGGLHWSAKLPVLFDPEYGVTALKVALEWLLVGINLVTIGVLWVRRGAFRNENIVAFTYAVAFSVVSELAFTLMGVDDTDWPSALGHFYKTAAYLYLFHATINEALRRPMQRLSTQQLRESMALTAATDGILWVDEEGLILKANPALEALTGYAVAEMVGRHVDLLSADRADPVRDYLSAAKNNPPYVQGLSDQTLRCRDGRLLPVEVSMGSWDDQGVRHAILYIRDVSERKKLEASLKHQATHDELTGLPNRWLFRLQLDQALASSGRSGQKVAVLYLDLDYFKNVNDTFGHATGDALLIQVGERVRQVLRANDTLARLGGDEFAVLLTDLPNGEVAARVAEKLIVSLQSSYQLNGQEVYAGGSLGLAIYPDDASDSDTLMRFADLALYQAKQAERGGCACYSPEMEKRTHDDLQLHTRLKAALANGELQLHYQPQVDVVSGALVAAEALLRWDDSVLGLVSPTRFIPVAEATGLILPLSDWVLQSACEQIAAWEKGGTPLHVAVNFSAQQFRQRNLPEQVRAALERAGASAQWLGIEVTESMAMTRPAEAREQLQTLAALGCSVALDDFGTGHSSLACLTSLPISKLKVDKQFMEGVPLDADNCAIAKAVIGLAHSLGITLVAEGVETDAQLAFLRSNGCEVYQGWLFAKAMPAAELTALMSRACDLSPAQVKSVAARAGLLEKVNYFDNAACLS